MSTASFILGRARFFYDRKNAAAQRVKREANARAIAFNFWKDLPSPNISTYDLYYKRQLLLYTFNVHNLKTEGINLYTYDETVRRKGANEVSSMLLHFFINLLP